MCVIIYVILVVVLLFSVVFVFVFNFGDVVKVVVGVFQGDFVQVVIILQISGLFGVFIGQFGVSQEQVVGGIGVLFGLVKNQLVGNDYL